MALRLAAGGKALMVLLGLAIIALGLWYGGLLPGAGDPGEAAGEPGVVPEVAGPPAEKEARREDIPQKDTPADKEPVRSFPPPDPEKLPDTHPEAADPHALEGEPVDTKDVRPPPLLASSPVALRAIGLSADDDVEVLFEDLSSGSVDVVEIEFHDLVESRPSTSGTVVVGARPPEKKLHLCARQHPLDSLQSGSRVWTRSVSEQILVAYLAEAKGMDAGELLWVEGGTSPSFEGEAELWVLDQEEAGLTCAGLHSMGAQGPSLLIAREDDVRLYGRSYLELVRKMEALDDGARHYLLGSPEAHRSYATNADYLHSLSSRLRDRPPASPPEVARWLVEMED